MTSGPSTFRPAEQPVPEPRPGGETMYDALVIGGGPAGAAAATTLARRGRSVLLVERERFPRFHVGESLIPETNRYLAAMGVLERIAGASFPVKRGAFLTAPDGENERYVFFGDAEGTAGPTTFEVSRGRFDQILLDHAISSGAEVLQACRAREVELDADGVTVRVEGDGAPRSVRGRYLVDASGRDGFLAKRLGLREADPELRMIGVHAWFKDVAPLPPEHAGDLRLISLADAGWAWLIPLEDGVTSVGVVASKQRWSALSAGAPERRLELLLESVPALSKHLSAARRVSEVRVDGDYSYGVRAYAGERWLLAGDAGSFLDPIFSTGVLLALASGTQAAEALDGALAAGVGSRRAGKILAGYEREQRRVYRFFRRFVLGYYRSGFGLRDLLVAPTEYLGLARAVVTALSGNSRPRLLVRLRLEAFFFFARVQRVFPVVPRLHGAATGGAMGPDAGPVSAS
jgi:flavin-dependent dehydrogenase